MDDDPTKRVNSQTRRRVLQMTSGLGTVMIGGVSTSAATTNLDITYSGGGWGATSTDDNNIMTNVNIEIEFSDEVSFGSDEDRGIKITNVDTGGTLRCTATEQFTIPAGEGVELSNIHNRDGTISDDPELQLNLDDLEFYAVDVEGDTDIFTDAPVFSTYTIEIIENLADPTTVATTDEAIRAVGLERSPIEQDGANGDIDLQLELAEALDSSWFVEFSLFLPDDGFVSETTEIPNQGTDTLEWTADFSESESGSYDGWRVAVYPNEEMTSNSDLMWSTTGYFAIDADYITIEQENGDEGESAVDTTLTLDNVGSGAWVITDIAGDSVTALSGEENPTIELEEGSRYRIKNEGWGAHPLAFERADGTVLLSQDGDGSFEADESVEWMDDGDTLEFTLTDELASELDRYICTIHSLMEGTVTIADPTSEDPPEEDDKLTAPEGFPAGNEVYTAIASVGEPNADGTFGGITLAQAITENADGGIDGVEIGGIEFAQIIAWNAGQ